MPTWFIFYVLIPLAVAVYGYLWVKAGKKDDKLEQILNEIRALRNDLTNRGDSDGDGEAESDTNEHNSV